MVTSDFNMNVKKFEIKAAVQPMPEGYPISAKIVADSVSEAGVRITTLELVFPRYVLAEFNTHRVFSRNASSSRAIPTKKLIQNAMDAFVEPVRYGINKAGMQAAENNLSGEALEEARKIWKEMAEFNMKGCLRLAELGLHKQWASRPVEWFSTIKVVVTSTDFNNFFILRDHVEAQDEICHLAQSMKVAMNESTPKLVIPDGWHLPYVTEEDLAMLGLNNCLKISAARCARTSYKTYHGVTSTLQEDMDLFKKLVHDIDDGDNPFHASPTEHQARPVKFTGKSSTFTGNFFGWEQHRKFIEHYGPDSMLV